jgi:hypothetical protein
MNHLLNDEPALAWKRAVGVEGHDPDSLAARQAAATVRRSPRVEALLAGCDRQASPYKKWNGRHWVIAVLSDLGCPPGDESLRPLVGATLDCWLSPGHAKYIRLIAGRVRRCASQEGYALWSALKLGVADARVDELAARLLQWQWPDGGWNCDKHPEADSSSFMESLIPLRALALYARLSGDAKVRDAAGRAAEVFLSRRLFLRRRDGRVMDPHFVRLHYPCYWHYDILFGLKVISEAGLLGDPRCREALDLLESKRLPDGGFPAEESYSRPTRPELSGYSPVSWGGVSRVKSNPFVSADALTVLRQAGRTVVQD